jgi:hypothetical protein
VSREQPAEETSGRFHRLGDGFHRLGTGFHRLGTGFHRLGSPQLPPRHGGASGLVGGEQGSASGRPDQRHLAIRTPRRVP